MLALYWRTAARAACAFALTAFVFAGHTSAAPLGLSPGDDIQFLEWDALQTVPGDGGSYDVSTNIYTGLGRINSVVLNGGGALSQTDVDFDFNLNFISENLTIAGNLITFNTVMASPGAALPGPDFVLRQAGINILTGNFTSGVVLTGNINVAGNSAVVVTSVGLLGDLGGDPNLIAALGGVNGVLLQTSTVFDFSPDLLTLIASGQVFDSNFTASMSGLLTPIESAPFVPEPSTAILVGGGLVGLLGVARRVRR